MARTYAGQIFYITGGSEGIGRAIAVMAASLGAHVVIVSRSQQKIDQALQDIEKSRVSPAQRFQGMTLDVTRWPDVQKHVEVYLATHGAPDFLINCAGLSRPGYIETLSIDDFHTMMDLNFFGVVHLCKAFAPAYLKQRKGHVINVSSMAGFLGLFGYTGYCASKYAVVGFSEALKNEWKPYNITVSVLCPPNTKTPGLDEENKTKPPEVLATEEKAKPVEAEDVAKALFMALPSKKFLINPTLDAKLAYYVKRVSPWIIEQITKRPTISQ